MEAFLEYKAPINADRRGCLSRRLAQFIVEKPHSLKRFVRTTVPTTHN